MTRTRQFANALASVSLLDRVDQLGSFFNAKPIDRPQRVDERRFKLTRPCWPDCPLCGCTVEDCNCDPDEYQAALLAEHRNKENDRVA